MEVSTAIVIIIIVLAILFFGYTVFKDNSSTGKVIDSYPARQNNYGGGCSR